MFHTANCIRGRCQPIVTVWLPIHLILLLCYNGKLYARLLRLRFRVEDFGPSETRWSLVTWVSIIMETQSVNLVESLVVVALVIGV